MIFSSGLSCLYHFYSHSKIYFSFDRFTLHLPASFKIFPKAIPSPSQIVSSFNPNPNTKLHPILPVSLQLFAVPFHLHQIILSHLGWILFHFHHRIQYQFHPVYSILSVILVQDLFRSVILFPFSSFHWSYQVISVPTSYLFECFHIYIRNLQFFDQNP